MKADRAYFPGRAEAPSQTRVVLQILCIILAVTAGLWTVYRLERLVLVLILATWFAYVMAPVVQFAERPVRIAGRTHRLPRGPAIILVYVVIAGAASVRELRGKTLPQRLSGRCLFRHEL